MSNRKPPEKRQGRAGTTRDLMVLPGGQPERPEPPKGLSKGTIEKWDAYWASDLARASVASDLPSLRRLFTYYDEWERAMDGYRKERIVAGSTGQPRLSPFFTVAQSLESSITALERQVGIGAKNRADLGIATGNAALTIAELNRMAEERDDRSDEDEALLGEWREAN